MTDHSHKLAPESLECIRAVPSSRQESSRDAGWTSLLVDLHWLTSSTDDYSSIVTPDQTLGLATSGRYDLANYRSGRWHPTVRQPGSIGMGRGGEVSRGRLTISPHRMAQCALLYLPHGQLLAASEHLRRIGQPLREPAFNLLVQRDAGIAQMISNLLQAMRKGVDDLYAESAATWLSVHLVSHYGNGAGCDDTRSPGTISDARLARVVEMMSMRFGEALTLDEMASEACISKYHFARLFRRKVGTTPYAFLTNIRMDTARRLLNTSDLPITEISASCGYTTPMNFSVAFAARYGVSPSTFRSEMPRLHAR